MLKNLSHRLFSRRRYKFLALIFAAIIFLVALISFHYIFQIKNIELSGIDSLSGIADIKNENLVFLDLEKFRKKMLEQNTFLESIDVRKNYPDTLKIIGVKNWKLVGVKVDGGYYLVNLQGRILVKIHADKVPYVNLFFYQNIFYKQFETGKYLKINDIVDALSIIDKLVDLGMRVDKIDVTSPQVVEITIQEKRYVFSTKKNIATQIEELKIILARLKLEKLEYDKVDLRFDKPILTVKNKT